MKSSKTVATQRSRWGRRILIAVAVFFTGIVIYRLVTHHRSRPPGQPTETVAVATAVSGPMPETIAALGTVTPTATVTVVPQLSGYLTAVGFTEGEDVAKGQFLAQIDPRPYEVQLQQYQAARAKDEASLGQARSDLARYRRLAAQSSIAAQQVTDQTFLVQEDEAAVKEDDANIATANLDLSYCHITAPVAGRVGLRLIDPGNYVTASSSTGILVITRMQPISVLFTIPQDDLGEVLARVNAGAKLDAIASSSDGKTRIASGTLTAIDNQISTSTGTVQLRAMFANADEMLFPNEFVNITLLVDTLSDATLVPTPAVQSGVPGDYVYIVKADHTVSLQPVTIGPSDGRDTVIEKGVSPGERVVTDGVDRLTDGAKVVVVLQGGAATP